MLNYFEALEKIDCPERWLDYYYQSFGEFWTTLSHFDEDEKEIFFKKWNLFNSDTAKEDSYNVNLRQILPIEIVIDIDCNTKERAIKISEQITKQLKKYKFNFSVWGSGGDGIHIHIFFPELLRFNDEERKYIKSQFIKEVEVDRGYADLTSTYPKRLISLELSKHRKGGYKKLIEIFQDNPSGNKLVKDTVEKALAELKKDSEAPKPIGVPSGLKWDGTRSDAFKDIDSLGITVDDVLRMYGIAARPGKNTNCPFHSSRAGNCFSHKDKVWYCFHCLRRGSPWQLVMQKENVEFRKAVDIIREFTKK